VEDVKRKSGDTISKGARRGDEVSYFTKVKGEE
jgi:hypothetical protein